MAVATLPADELRDLYKSLILAHAREPRNYGPMAAATHEARGLNRLCGDRLHIYLSLDGDRLSDARFDGTGCAISMASASLLTEAVQGMPKDEALEFGRALIARLNGDGDIDSGALGDLRALEGVREFPSRVKCATLAWQTLFAAFESGDDVATTE